MRKKVQKEFDNKTALIQRTTTNFRSQIKFLAKLWEHFKIKTAWDKETSCSIVLSCPILCSDPIWERVIREWRKKVIKCNILNGFNLGRWKSGLQFGCLGFAYDIVFVEEKLEIVIEKVGVLKGREEKTGLKISFEKIEYTNIRHQRGSNWTMRTNYDDIKRIHKIK